MKKTRESQYQFQVDLKQSEGLEPMGLSASATYLLDPRRLGFLMARYKFVSKMLAGKGHVLEVGCGDCFGLRIVQQTVGKMTAIDFDKIYIEDARQRMRESWPFECFLHDILTGPLPGEFEAAYSLDVLEHIPASQERVYMENVAKCLTPDGVLIVGMPSLESQAYASEPSRKGHVNCKTGEELKSLLAEFFANVFLFSMNDEVMHTGYSKMAHYIFVMGVGVRNPK